MDNLSIIGLIAIIAYLAVYATFVLYLSRRNRVRTQERKNRFFKALFEGLKSDAVASLDDVINIYKGVSIQSSEDSNYKVGLSRHLREFLVYIISKEKSLVAESLQDGTIKDWKQKITEYISQNESLSPYADLPAAERNVLNDINAFIAIKDFESLKRKTSELAGMIQARQSESTSIRNTNRWSVPLSIIGLILTILFGLLALVWH